MLVSQPCKNVKQMLFTLKRKMKIKKTNTTFHLEILSNQNNIFLFFDLKSKMKIKKSDTTLDLETLSNQNSNMIFLLFSLKTKMKIRKPPLSWMSILNSESHSVTLRVVWGGL